MSGPYRIPDPPPVDRPPYWTRGKRQAVGYVALLSGFAAASVRFGALANEASPTGWAVVFAFLSLGFCGAAVFTLVWATLALAKWLDLFGLDES